MKIHFRLSNERLITPKGISLVGQLLSVSNFIKKNQQAANGKEMEEYGMNNNNNNSDGHEMKQHFQRFFMISMISLRSVTSRSFLLISRKSSYPRQRL